MVKRGHHFEWSKHMHQQRITDMAIWGMLKTNYVVEKKSVYAFTNSGLVLSNPKNQYSSK